MASSPTNNPLPFACRNGQNPSGCRNAPFNAHMHIAGNTRRGRAGRHRIKLVRTSDRWRQCVMVLVGLLATLILAACGSSKEGTATLVTSAPSTTAPSTTAAPDKAAELEKAILSAYRAFWTDVVAVGRTADWQSQRLAEHATGATLKQIREQFKAAKDRGWIAKGTVRVSPSVVSHSATRAEVRDCVDATQFGRFDPKARRWIDQPGGLPDAERVVLVLDPQGGWKVAETVVTGECER